jgi:hypothetical protein
MDGRLLRAAPMFNPENIDQYGTRLVPARPPTRRRAGAECVRPWRAIPPWPFN